jgi:hypothetical protein
MVWLVLPWRSRYSTSLNPKLFGGPVVAGVTPALALFEIPFFFETNSLIRV